MRNIFLEKSYRKCGGETIPRPFSKTSKFRISLNQYSKVLYILFLFFAKLRTIETDSNLAADHLLLPHIKLFQKTKRGLELVYLPSFLHDFFKKNYVVIIY